MITPQPLWANSASAWSLTAKKCLLVFRLNFPVFHLWTLPLLLSLDTTEESVVPFIPSLEVLTHMDKVYLSLLQAVPALSASLHTNSALVP